MAKSSSFFGLRRGSTKSLTFQVLDGQQITKDRVTHVHNPRTEQQMMQRVFMYNVQRAYMANTKICDHSFEGVSYGAKSMQYFMSENLKRVREAVRKKVSDLGMNAREVSDFRPLGGIGFGAQDYLVSKGSLPALRYTWFQGDDADNPSQRALALLISEGDIANPTYQDFKNFYGCEAGDQVTFVINWIDVQDNVRTTIIRNVLQGMDAEGKNVPLSETPISNLAAGDSTDPYFEDEGPYFVVGVQQVTVNGATYNALVVTVRTAMGCAEMLGCYCVLSRKNGNSWLRSTQNLVCMDYDGTLGEAISESETSIEVLDNSRILNNATSNVSVAAAQNVLNEADSFVGVGSDECDFTGSDTIATAATNASTINVVLIYNAPVSGDPKSYITLTPAAANVRGVIESATANGNTITATVRVYNSASDDTTNIVVGAVGTNSKITVKVAGDL